MPRLIDADALIPDMGFGVRDLYSQKVIDNAPTIEAVTVVHARWNPVPSSDMSTGKAYKCSACQKMRYGSYMPPYCQCCGAKMEAGR